MEYGIGILIPLFGTVLGSALVLGMKRTMQNNMESKLLGLASGVMVAASIWSLLIPAIELSSGWGKWSFVPAVIGFVIGALLLYGLNYMWNGQTIDTGYGAKCDPDSDSDDDNGNGIVLQRSQRMMLLAITLHNIPEGMAVGVAFAGAMSPEIDMSILGAFILSVGIAIQNIPEGAVVTLPVWANGYGKSKAFGYGILSGVVEPIAAGITMLVAGFITIILPYLLAFAAGAMIYVVLEELLPEAVQNGAKTGYTWGFVIGFLLMMSLDVALG